MKQNTVTRNDGGKNRGRLFLFHPDLYKYIHLHIFHIDCLPFSAVRTTKSKKAGTIFPIGRIKRHLQEGKIISLVVFGLRSIEIFEDSPKNSCLSFFTVFS